MYLTAYLYKNLQVSIDTLNCQNIQLKNIMKRIRDKDEDLDETQIEKKYIIGKDQDNNLITNKVKNKKKNKHILKENQETNIQQARALNSTNETAYQQDKRSKTTQKSDGEQRSEKKIKKKKNKEKQVVDQKQQIDDPKQKTKSNSLRQENNQQREQASMDKQKKKIKYKKKQKQTSKLQQILQKNVEKHPSQQLRPENTSKQQNQVANTEKKKKNKKSKKEKAEKQVFDQQEQANQQQNLNEIKMEFNDNRSQYSVASILPTNKVESQPSKKKDKSEKKSKKQQKTINETNRQMAKQCITQKSNFYLHKQDLIRMGLPVGRGSRKQQEQMLAQRKKIKNEKIKINKLRRKAFLQSKQGSHGSQGSIDTSKAKSKDESLANYKSKIIKKDDCTKEESFRIINEFEKDAGDYKCLVKVLGYPLAKIRSHLRTLFEYCIAIISGKVIENGMKINDWQLIEKREIIRQLHRIRCTNRLLSEQNVEFRQKFHKLMKSYNDPNIKLQNNDYNYLYRKIEAFVRGYCTLGTKKKQEVKTQDSFQLNRPPLLEGGYILDKNRVKREVKMQVKLQQKKEEEQQKKIDLDKIIYDWSEQQQRNLSQFYIQNHSNFDYIIDQLTLKFGKKNRWKDFQILGRKVDHLVKLGLLKIQQLTSRPYNREQRYKQEQEKNKNKHKIIDPTSVRSEVNSLDLLTQFIYNNKKVLNKPSDTYENGVFQNPSLLQRQIFGHVESYKVRIGLVGLMRQKYPSQQQIDKVIKVAHQFMTWAEDWEQKNGIIQIKNKNLLNPKIKYKATSVKKTLSQESLDNNPNQFQDLIFELNDYQLTEKMEEGSIQDPSDMFAMEANRSEDQIMRQM